MAYSGRGRLANAISEAGDLGLCHDIGCVNCWTVEPAQKLLASRNISSPDRKGRFGINLFPEFGTNRACPF